MQAVNIESDLEIITPIPIDGIGEYFYFPMNKNIGVSKDGKLINTINNKQIVTFPSNNKKRIQFRFDNKTYKLHRVLGITFIGRPSRHLNKKYSDLEINHIDGDSLNNKLTNLEWVTGKENIKHCHLNNLHPNDKIVLARNIFNNKIIKFNSIKACADYFNLHRSTLFKHLKQGKIDLFHKDFFVFKFDNNVPWVIQPKEKLKLLSDKSNLGIHIVITYKDKSKPNVICDGYKSTSIISKLPITTIYRNLIKHRLYETNQIKVQYAIDLIKNTAGRVCCKR